MINVFNSPIEASNLDEFHEKPQRTDEDNAIFEAKKRRPQVSYITDGRKLVDGIIADEQKPDSLWTTAITRGAANEWRNKAETGAVARAKRYVSHLTYEASVLIHTTARRHGTILLLLLNTGLIVFSLYLFKVIVW